MIKYKCIFQHFSAFLSSVLITRIKYEVYCPLRERIADVQVMSKSGKIQFKQKSMLNVLTSFEQKKKKSKTDICKNNRENCCMSMGWSKSDLMKNFHEFE